MQVIALLVGGIPGASGSGGQLEVLVLVVAVVLAVILLLVRHLRSADRKKRRASAFGYFDRDVAHYAAGAPHESAVDEPRTMAPSFVAPTHARRKSSRSAPPVPTVPLSGFGASGSVRAFDPVEAERIRPPDVDADNDATPSPIPELPPPPPPRGRIPLMEVPPPPAVPPPPR